MSTRWSIAFSLLAGAPADVVTDHREAAGQLAEWAERWRTEKNSPGSLEFEDYSDQFDVFIRRNNGRRIRFITLMCEGPA